MELKEFLKRKLLKGVYRYRITEDQIFFSLAVITAISASLVAIFIHKSVQYLTQLIGTDRPFEAKTTIIAGLCVLVSGYLTTRKYPETSGSGLPLVRVCLLVYNGRIAFVSWMAKLFVSILSLVSGMSLGREGPTATVSAGLGSSLGRFFALPKKKVKALILIGVAGGISAAFATPIAAVIFTLEEIAGDLNTKYLGPIMISSVISSLIVSVFIGHESTFTAVKYALYDFRELIFYFLVGVLAATFGIAWKKFVLSSRKYNLKLFRGHRLTIIMCTFGIMALLSYVNPAVLGSGHQVINQTLLAGRGPWEATLFLFGLKFFAVGICYASGISGGLFMPTLFLGAMLGATIGQIAALALPLVDIQVGAYALVGMGAFFAAVIRAPFTSIIMVFELTRDYNLILPLMAANITAYVLANRFHDGSIYESISEQDGIHLPSKEDFEILENLHVEDAMRREVFTVDANESVQEALNKVENITFSSYPVTHHRHMVGMTARSQLSSLCASGKGDNQLWEVCKKDVIHIYQDQSLLVAFHKLKTFQVSLLPVVSRVDDTNIVGVVTAEDIVNHFGFHILEDKEEQKDVPSPTENREGV